MVVDHKLFSYRYVKQAHIRLKSIKPSIDKPNDHKKSKQRNCNIDSNTYETSLRFPGACSPGHEGMNSSRSLWSMPCNLTHPDLMSPFLLTLALAKMIPP